MTMDEQISIIVDGIMVEGVVRFLSVSDIRVEIAFPFAGVSESLHIPYFSRPYSQYEHDGALTPMEDELLKRCSKRSMTPARFVR